LKLVQVRVNKVGEAIDECFIAGYSRFVADTSGSQANSQTIVAKLFRQPVSWQRFGDNVGISHI